MLPPEKISELHRLHFVEKWPSRKIARHLRIGRRTIAKYLDTPAPPPIHHDRGSKLDAFKEAINDMLRQDPSANAPVIAQNLRPLGYDGGITIVKDYLHAVRVQSVARRAYVRVEPGPGDRFDVDWGHFGALTYNGATRKLYAFCLVDGHSRKMFLEFTHSQSFESFVRCHIHAFLEWGGCAREIWFDNLATAVAEHDGNLVRFNPRFLAFAREYNFVPRACHVAAAWEKGKVERAIGYVRQNFWPLRSFTDLVDVNLQARRWLKEIANQRRHRETGQAPDERFQPETLRPLPAMIPDYRDAVEALVHKDLRRGVGQRQGRLQELPDQRTADERQAGGLRLVVDRRVYDHARGRAVLLDGGGLPQTRRGSHRRTPGAGLRPVRPKVELALDHRRHARTAILAGLQRQPVDR
jgi:transposase